MRWHVEHSHTPGEMSHPTDSVACKTFDKIHPFFASESRNVRKCNAMSVKDLQNMEQQLDSALKNIRSQKVYIFDLCHENDANYEAYDQVLCKIAFRSQCKARYDDSMGYKKRTMKKPAYFTDAQWTTFTNAWKLHENIEVFERCSKNHRHG
ncbi:hypothetical protein SASPL_133562 [Salvia splendens]|uniref:K-box domain-containing protein n=1 Tax=Salvia splendens TaxID=180675 RepID=A0A8X8X413_SALSN|nr:hypothetical protein SASPL_133562 [Salvia splendens]